MKWYVTVFAPKDERLVWASGPVSTLVEAMRLAREAADCGMKVFMRSPTGEVTEVKEVSQ